MCSDDYVVLPGILDKWPWLLENIWNKANGHKTSGTAPLSLVRSRRAKECYTMSSKNFRVNVTLVITLTDWCHGSLRENIVTLMGGRNVTLKPFVLECQVCEIALDRELKVLQGMIYFVQSCLFTGRSSQGI